jgi:hypothetical protein
MIMKTLILSLLCLIGIASFAQNVRPPSPAKPAQNFAPNGVVVDSLTGQTLVCKGTPIPEGLVVSGEMFTDSCQDSAWIVKPKVGTLQ